MNNQELKPENHKVRVKDMSLINKARGFTLIEVMIVVVIIGVLASIAYPSYQRYIERGNRTEGKAAIATVAQQLERCFTRNNTYVGCTVADGATENGLYTLAVSNITATTYTITAAQQFGDTTCGNLSLEHNGTKGSNNNTVCW